MAINNKNALMVDVINQLILSKLNLKFFIEMTLLMNKQNSINKSSKEWQELETQKTQLGDDAGKRLEELEQRIEKIKGEFNDQRVDDMDDFLEKQQLFPPELTKTLKLITEDEADQGKIIDEAIKELIKVNQDQDSDYRFDDDTNQLISELINDQAYQIDEDTLKSFAEVSKSKAEESQPNTVTTQSNTVAYRFNTLTSKSISIKEKVASDISAVLADEILGAITSRMNQARTSNPTGPYIEELNSFTEELKKVIHSIGSHQIDAEDGRLILRSMLEVYSKKNGIHEAVKDNIKQLEDLSHLEPCLLAIEEAQSLAWEATVKEQKEAELRQKAKNEFSVLSFNDKINKAAKLPTGPGIDESVSNQMALAQLKVVYKELLAYGIETNSPLKPQRNPEEKDQDYITRACKEFFSDPSIKAHTVKQTLKDMNQSISRLPDDYPYFLKTRMMYADNEPLLRTLGVGGLGLAAFALAYKKQDEITGAFKLLADMAPDMETANKVIVPISSFASAFATLVYNKTLQRIENKAIDVIGDLVSKHLTEAARKAAEPLKDKEQTTQQEFKQRIKDLATPGIKPLEDETKSDGPTPPKQ